MRTKSGARLLRTFLERLHCLKKALCQRTSSAIVSQAEGRAGVAICEHESGICCTDARDCASQRAVAAKNYRLRWTFLRIGPCNVSNRQPFYSFCSGFRKISSAQLVRQGPLS